MKLLRPNIVRTSSIRDQISGSGLEPYLRRLPPKGHANPDDYIDGVLCTSIQEAQSEIELECGIFLTQRIIKSRFPDDQLVRGQDYDIVQDAYPYFQHDWLTYGTIQLRHKPIASVERVQIRYGQQQTLQVATFPNVWTMFEANTGTVHVVPLLTATMQQMTSLVMLPILNTSVAWADHIPLIISVDYTAGFLPRDFDVNKPGEEGDISYQCPDHDVRSLAKAVKLLAAKSVLQKVQNAVSAGGGGLSLDGFSQSFPSARFDSTMKGFEESAKAILKTYGDTNSGGCGVISI